MWLSPTGLSVLNFFSNKLILLLKKYTFLQYIKVAFKFNMKYKNKTISLILNYLATHGSIDKK